MKSRCLAVAISIVGILAAAGCGLPFLHPAATVSTSDPGLVGEWATKDAMPMKAVIGPTNPDSVDNAYAVMLTVQEGGKLKTALNLDLKLTDIEGTRYADIFLARPEREKLVGSYGFLVLPVHQVMKVAREGDSLTVWTFRGDWVEDNTTGAVFSHETVTVGNGQVSLATAPTRSIRELLAQHGSDPGAFSKPIVFHRVGSVQSPQ